MKKYKNLLIIFLCIFFSSCQAEWIMDLEINEDESGKYSISILLDQEAQIFAIETGQTQIGGLESIIDSLPEGFDAYVFDYKGLIPSKEFYEPFGQITYWERQEVSFDFPVDGTYYLAVFDKKDNSGKYALAIGTIEDFSAYDFFTILPYAWLESKLFVNDYFSAVIAVSIFIAVLTLIGFGIYRKLKNRN